MPLHPLFPCGVASSGVAPPLPLDRSAECTATRSAVRRSRAAGGAATVAANRDDTRNEDAHNNIDARNWNVQYDFTRRRTLFVQHQSRQTRFGHPALKVSGRAHTHSVDSAVERRAISCVHGS